MPSPTDVIEESDVVPVNSCKLVNFVELHSSWVQVEQTRDPEIQTLIRRHKNGELPETIAHIYDVRDGILHRKVERNKVSS